jgi:diacylglycerol kinase (ATP)
MHESPYKGKKGLKRVWNAFCYSLDGFADAYRNESAFRQESWLALVLVPTAFFLPVSAVAKALLVSSVLQVLLVELLNSAVEAAVDRISLDDHRLAKRAKDVGSAAVFVSLTITLVVWVLVLLP